MKATGERNSMEGRNEFKISAICTRIISGDTFKSTIAEYYEGNIPRLNTKDIHLNRTYKTDKIISDLGLKSSSAKLIAINSVIVRMYVATTSKTAIIKIPLTTNQACCNLTIDPTTAYYRFVYYALCNDYDRLTFLANDRTQQNLNAQQIKYGRGPISLNFITHCCQS
jgi:type I restriction enzyme, S subunit